ncbi:MAG: phosphate transport system regulatory protein PhoU [Acidobacteria bacterium 13_1_20CM_3_53_8]|nr:MAG: phosphate transport system regulatory protein PhoU [Acidobacteria bacterium 13_1_20CM_3_53_8]
MELHRRLDDELNALRDRMLILGGEAEKALQRAIFSLVERDTSTAHEVLVGDDEIDRLEVEIDHSCIDIIALRQPAARDLRFVMAVVKMTPILERIADHACNIARIAIDLNDEPRLRSYAELQRMAEHASSMLHSALDAFTESDAKAARKIIERDLEINDLYGHIFHDLIEMMAHDSATSSRAARLLLIAKHIERVGDYVKDICELTVYMTEAAYIKHSK